MLIMLDMKMYKAFAVKYSLHDLRLKLVRIKNMFILTDVIPSM